MMVAPLKSTVMPGAAVPRRVVFPVPAELPPLSVPVLVPPLLFVMIADPRLS
jgi:hypothetical protein